MPLHEKIKIAVTAMGQLDDGSYEGYKLYCGGSEQINGRLCIKIHVVNDTVTIAAFKVTSSLITPGDY